MTETVREELPFDDLPRQDDLDDRPLIVTARFGSSSSPSRVSLGRASQGASRATQTIGRQHRVVVHRPALAPPAPWFRQRGTVRRVQRWLAISGAGLATLLVVILVPPVEDLPEPVSRPALRSAESVAPVPPPAFAEIHGTQVRDPFEYRAAAYSQRPVAAPAPVPVAIPAVPSSMAESAIEIQGVQVVAVLPGAQPAASLSEGGRSRLVVVGDQVRGATITAITADGVTLTRGERTAHLVPRSGLRPLAMRPFRDSGGPTVRVRTPAPLVAAPSSPPRRRLGVTVRDAGRSAPGGMPVAIQTVARTDVDLRPGDALISIDGVPVASSADAMRVLADRATAAGVTLVVQRGGTPLTVTVPWKE